MGITTAASVKALQGRLAGRPPPPYISWSPEQRCSLNERFPGAESVLVGAVSYRDRYRSFPQKEEQACLSPFAWAPDYHLLVAEMLQQLATYIRELVPGAKTWLQVDNGPGCERLLAWRAGVGWQGRNNFIIVPGVGSFVWLGLLATDLVLPEDTPLPSLCGECDLCIKACPTNAYRGQGDYDFSRCIAYWLTQKQPLTRAQAKVLNRHQLLYGCDYCQLACPYNSPNPAPVYRDWQRLLALSNRAFKELFQDSAAMWRGSRVLRRNLVFAAASCADCNDALVRLAQEQGLVADTARRVLNH